LLTQRYLDEDVNFEFEANKNFDWYIPSLKKLRQHFKINIKYDLLCDFDSVYNHHRAK